MTRTLPALVLSLVAAAIILLVPVADANADFLRLADGSVVQGEITDHDDHSITVRRLDNGGHIRLTWSQLHDEDRMRLRKEYGLELPDFRVLAVTNGDRIETFEGDVYEGRITSERNDRYVIEMRDDARDDDRMATKSIPKKDVRDIFRDVKIDAMALKKPIEIYEETLERFSGGSFTSLDANQHFIMVKYCEMLGLYDEGRLHIDEALLKNPDFSDRLEPIRQLFDDLEAQSYIRVQIEEATRLIRREKFVEADVVLAEVLATEGIAPTLAALASDRLVWLNEEAQSTICKRWFRLIEVKAKIAGGKMNLQEARAYAGAQMEKDIISTLVDEIMPRDGSHTDKRADWEKKAKELFEARNKDDYRTIKVTVDLVALEGRAPGQGPGGAQGQSDGDGGLPGGMDPDQIRDQIRDFARQMRDNPEKADEYRKQIQDLMRGLQGGGGSGGRRRSVEEPQDDIDPDHIWSVDELQKQDGPDAVAQDDDNRGRGNRGNRGNRDNGNGNGQNPFGNRGQQRNQGQGQNGQQAKPTPQEMWERASSMTHRNYLVYLYCNRAKSIELIREKARGAAVQLWYR